jgi:hypothetical protein
MSIFDQMGNIYSEVGRTFKAKQNHDQERYAQALTRAIDLFDATTQVLIEQRSPKTKEVLRAKEVFLYACQTTDSSDEKEIDRYFMQFAIAARLMR